MCRVFGPIFILCWPLLSRAQVKGVVLDSVTRQPVAYVNIWVEGENNGTTSDTTGNFALSGVADEDHIVFSAIGYATRRVAATGGFSPLLLKPQALILSEVTIAAAEIEQQVGRFRKSKINHYFACGGRPWIVARFFPYKDAYAATPYLKTLYVLTNSKIAKARFNIRLYTVAADGRPEGYLYGKNILVDARKGKRKIAVDLDALGIVIPEKGFFVAVEWLIIEGNRHEFEYFDVTNDKKEGVRYEPAVGAVPAETNANSWFLIKGTWRQWPQNNSAYIARAYKNKYSLLAIELTLTN